MKRAGIISLLCVITWISSYSQVETSVTLKTPGNKAITYPLQQGGYKLIPEQELPVDIILKSQALDNERIELTYTIFAFEDIWFNLSHTYKLNETNFENCQFYLPGFWYKRNMRSPDNAPSLRASENWTVREDRLSTPMSGVYDEKTQTSYTVMRKGEISKDALTTHNAGEVMLSGESQVGYVGFGNQNGKAELRFGIPAWEAPYAYIRKLTLAPEVKNFMFLAKDEIRSYTWVIQKNNASDYADFITKTWQYSYDMLKPKFIVNRFTRQETMQTLSQFFLQSYVETETLKGFSGEGLRTDLCEVKPDLEVGFVGRVLLNAFNCLEYGETMNEDQYTSIANRIFDSYLQYGFNDQGYFREKWNPGHETDIYSIRRQSEGAYAILLYLNYEKKKGRSHPEWEKRMQVLMDNFLSLQMKDFSFPRKFKANKEIIDESGGSSACAIPTLAMAATYFGNKGYQKAAENTAIYMEKEIVNKSDYFSSTLDANCEDKEASYYTAVAYYYLAIKAKGKQKAHYTEMAKKAAYFAATWYYLWDVPFAQGQMLGDIGLKSRGWGNVSVENNHIDVYAFDLPAVFDWLSETTDEMRFSELALLMRTSMFEQLLPYPGHMCGIAKTGYYPEVVQHTQWDYGKNGKGYYNDIFAPGWVVASLWQMLMPDRVAGFFEKD